MLELVEEALFLRGGVGDHLPVAPHREQVEVDADRACGKLVAEPRGDERAPVAALRREALVAENLRHQLGQNPGDLLHAEARLPGPERERVAGQRRRDHRERVGRIGTEPRRIGEHRDQLEELHDRAGPAVQEQERHRVRSAALLVDEMQVGAGDRNGELAQGVQPRFLRAPVESLVPVFRERPHVCHAGAGRPRRERRLVRKAGAREALAQVGERLVGNAELERRQHAGRHAISLRRWRGNLSAPAARATPSRAWPACRCA
ncbi:MAG: hypothetical protein M5U08_23525 [Burkholderiales bacterium]|nr:hypothetical protein [Burkholderiales bacterium]